MGLSENKSRRKIDKDPNNTKWARNTNSFGHKILRSQGWEPGQYLGAKDAAQAAHYTAANASFVRVALKDDMLGLGFKRAKDEQVTGMNVFQDMLARLNGKSDEAMTKEREARQSVQTTLYCDSKFGPMRFVKGGWLVGDQEQDSPVAQLKEEENKRTAKKRKADEATGSSDDSTEDEKSKKMKRRKEARRAKKKEEVVSPNDTDGDPSVSEKTEEKKKRKAAKLAEKPSDGSETETVEKPKKSKKSKDRTAKDTDDKAAKRAEKNKKSKDPKTSDDAEKAARKEKKRLKKEQKRAEASTPIETGTSTPTTGSGTSTPVLRGHHAVRSKWIASKKMATMDDAALNQIFMIKAPSS